MHECDLFLLSSHNAYLANNALRQFAIAGIRNIHGWGIGGYNEGRAIVTRTESSATEANDLSTAFRMASSAVISSVIISHLRLSSRGAARREANNHPFKLSFLGYDWLMTHNGSASNGIEFVNHNNRLLIESDNDSARVFEFLRKKIITYCEGNTRHSLIEGVRKAFDDLISFDTGGSFNIMLTNGYISFAFTHWRTFYLLHREKDSGDVALISTIKLTDDEEWIEFNPSQGKKAKMLVFCGPTLIFNGDVPK